MLYKSGEWYMNKPLCIKLLNGWMDDIFTRLVNCIPNFFVLGKHKWGKGCLLYLHTHLYTITYLDNFTTSYKYEETNHINMLYLAVYLPQALYKLYSVAANHRQLYNHAFPGHQTEQQPEQDKKQNWPHTVHADTLWTVTVERTVRERKRCGTVHHYNRNISPQSPTTATSGTYSSAHSQTVWRIRLKRLGLTVLFVPALENHSISSDSSPFFHRFTVNTVSLADTHIKAVCAYFVMDVVCWVQCYL